MESLAKLSSFFWSDKSYKLTIVDSEQNFFAKIWWNNNITYKVLSSIIEKKFDTVSIFLNPIDNRLDIAISLFLLYRLIVTAEIKLKEISFCK